MPNVFRRLAALYFTVRFDMTPKFRLVNPLVKQTFVRAFVLAGLSALTTVTFGTRSVPTPFSQNRTNGVLAPLLLPTALCRTRGKVLLQQETTLTFLSLVLPT